LVSRVGWCGNLDATHGQGRGAAYRHYWELSVLYGVQAGLRSADRWVPGSRRYTDPATLLLPPQQWAGQRDDCTVTGTDANPQRQLERLDAQLHAAVGALEAVRGLTKWCCDLSGTTFVKPGGAGGLLPSAVARGPGAP
jgi:hypothetical protein